MPVKIKPENFKSVARLAAQVKTTKEMRSRSSQWNGLHRLMVSEGRLWLLTTDENTFLEWNIPTEEEPTHHFDVAIEAGKFNDVIPRLSDADFVEVSPRDGFLSLSQGTRVLRMQLQPAGDYPRPDREAGSPVGTSTSWRKPSKPLAKSLAFIAHFIDCTNTDPGKRVATLGPDGTLRAGGPLRQGRVHGLEAPSSTLNFELDTADKVSSFLTMLGEQVDIAVEEGLYTFSCPEGAHRLVVRGGSHSFPDTSESLSAQDYEKLRVDRKTFEVGMVLLGTLVPEKGKPLEIRIRGHQDAASIRLSTPGQVEAERSNDEFPIIRTFQKHGNDPEHEGILPAASVADTILKVRSESLRDIVSKLEGEHLILKFFPRNKFLLIEEDTLNRNGPFRSVLTTVRLLGTRSETPNEDNPPKVTGEDAEPGTGDHSQEDRILVGVAASTEQSDNGTRFQPRGTRRR